MGLTLYQDNNLDVDDDPTTGQNGPHDNQMIVNALEYCCFVLPGMMAPAMATVFFPPKKDEGKVNYLPVSSRLI